MKRPLDENGYEGQVPELEVAIAAAFKPDQKRRATDVYKKGTDGTGYIEGKVFEQGTVVDGSWGFDLTVELGHRAHVLLSGDISKYFHELPITVGAQVRLGLNGMTFEDLDTTKSKLHLGKRFVWRDGVVIFVHDRKTKQEVFFNTFDERPSVVLASFVAGSIDILEACAPNVPKKRKRTPPPPPATAYSTSALPAINESIPDRLNNTTTSLLPQNDMDVDPPEPETTPNPTVVAQDKTQVASSDPDSQNPQSLPSPPPEVFAPREDDGHVPTVEHSTHVQPNDRHPVSPTPATERLPSNHLHRLSPSEPPTDQAGARKLANAEAGPSRLPPQSPTAHKSAKELRRRERRQLKQLRNAGKLRSDFQRESAGVDPEEYWATAENDIPDALLFHEIDEQTTDTEGLLRAGPTDPDPHVEQEPQRTETSPGPVSQSQDSHGENSDPIESLRTGCPTSFGVYTPLINIGSVGLRHIMGIVSSISPTLQTKKSEFMMKLVLVDPSNFATKGLNVSLFEKVEKMLPQPEVGDVLLLRSIGIDDFNGSCAVGASYKGWQWAVFNAKTGQFSSAPQNTSALRHFQPEKSEMQYSIRMSDWWRDISTDTMSFGIETSFSSKRERVHKLISEADTVSYFNCTVEVLHGYESGLSVYTVFVTDYTHNESVAPVQAAWCPPKLAGIVLQVELWDSSAAVGPTMQAGEFYSIRNMRLKVSGGGFFEGKMQEGNKIVKLDEDALENQPHFVALLKRKMEWEADAKISGGVYEFPHQLVEQVEENRHFSCTVEVVYVSLRDECLYLYVTDYTARTDLVPVSATIASGALASRIVRISLFDAQVDTAKNLAVGDFVSIRNLRLHPSGGGSLLCGRLGGDQRLITKLNPKATGNAELRELLTRKEEFEVSQAKPKTKKSTAARAARQAAAKGAPRLGRDPPSTKRIAKQKEDTETYVSLSDVKASESCPAVFRVRARVVDFFPDNLRDCTILRCTSCNKTIPKSRRRCTKCDDVMEDETFVRAFFQLFFRIRDEEGTTLDVSVSDERCSVLQDLAADHVHEDDEAFDMFVARVKPLFGNLLEVHDGEACRRPVAQDDEAIDGPMLDLILGAWLPEGELDTTDARAYVALKHSVLESDI